MGLAPAAEKQPPSTTAGLFVTSSRRTDESTTRYLVVRTVPYHGRCISNAGGHEWHVFAEVLYSLSPADTGDGLPTAHYPEGTLERRHGRSFGWNSLLGLES